MKKERVFIGIIFLFLFFILFTKANITAAQRVVPLEERACKLLEMGNIEEAEKFLQKALEANPENLNAQLYLGIAFYKKKDKEKASEKFEHVEKEVDRIIGSSKPFGDEAMFTMMGMDRKADLLFSEEKKGLLYFCRGLTFKETKDWNGAEKKFKNALKLNYDPKTTRLQLIEVYINKQDIESASAQLAELKKTNEKNETMIFIDGYINYRKGNFQEALTAFEILATSSLSAKTNLALLYYNNGDYAKSVEKWEEILSEEPDNKMAQINMGRALFHLGDTSKAQEYFSKAGITLSPEKFSPKKIPLIYENRLEEIKFDLMCKVE